MMIPSIVGDANLTRYAFLTDIHLDCLPAAKLESFLQSLSDQSADVDGYLISGDISTSPLLEKHLRLLLTACEKSIVFCLGNHDFWYGSIENIRRNAHVMSRESSLDWPCLYYVNSYQYIPLTPKTAVVGHDGWYDGLYGNAKGSNFLMNDWWNIKEFNDVSRTTVNKFGSRIDWIGKQKVIELCQELASKAATHVKAGIRRAVVDGYENVIVLTHVPPWEEAHVHEGKPGGSEAAPWFTSRLMGDMLEGAAKRYPDVEFTVLCGHTHGRVDVAISQNLTCRVGGSDYVDPQTQFVLEIE
jgi:3',5'-cyclic-AMP phosphodiesterase